MRVLAWLYEKITHRPAIEPIQRYGPLMLIWKLIRKYLCVSVIPYWPFNSWRICAYRLCGFSIGRNVWIGMQVYMDNTTPDRLIIEDDVVISYRVTFATHGPHMKASHCILRKGCYIGTCATILGGVNIGRYSLVGACSLVNHDVPPFTTVGGVPAHVLKTNTVPWHRQQHILEEYLAEKAAADKNPEHGKPA